MYDKTKKEIEKKFQIEIIATNAETYINYNKTITH